MRTRVLSSLGVVVVGLVPAIAGGPVFALLLLLVGILASREYRALTLRLDAVAMPAVAGPMVIATFVFAALAGWRGPALVGLAGAVVALPMLLVLGRSSEPGAFVGWSLAVAGSFYLGLPLFSAIALREMPGTIDATWLVQVADFAALGWTNTPRGLAWVLLVVIATWIGDSTAYLVGRAWGRRPLAPRLSPRKTIEGAIGGLAGSAVIAGIAVVLFGLGIPPVIGVALGAGLGLIGQLGDLCESMLKRQADVKDSGTIIPGHGGILDRIDALLFALPAGWVAASLLDGMLHP